MYARVSGFEVSCNVCREMKSRRALGYYYLDIYQTSEYTINASFNTKIVVNACILIYPLRVHKLFCAHSLQTGTVVTDI
jgi:hypothetical protein